MERGFRGGVLFQGEGEGRKSHNMPTSTWSAVFVYALCGGFINNQSPFHTSAANAGPWLRAPAVCHLYRVRFF